MKFSETEIPGCFEIQPQVLKDGRGSFVKTFHAEWFDGRGLRVDYVEQYYSTSVRGVVRGLHFQLPPHAHAKLVYCVAGRVQDVAMDLRGGSPTFGAAISVELSAEQGNLLYLPAGCAHGFCVLSESATLVCSVTSVHHPEADAGVHWRSAQVRWAIESPILSARDRGFPALDQFTSPFAYQGGGE